MDMPLISIIVPVYKVEPYLRKCVDSILAQTYENLEVILIDDGSPDGCPAICDEYARKDSRVVVIHQSNAGVSAARNVGLGLAKGDYISFVDSDDWIESDFIERLYTAIVENDADASESSYCMEHNGQNCIPQMDNTSIIFSGDDILKALITNGPVLKGIGGRLYKGSLVEDLVFHTEISNGEDTLFAVTALTKCNKLVHLDYQGYHYLEREDSAFHCFRESYWSMQIASDLIVEVIRDNSPCLLKYAESRSIIFDVELSRLIYNADLFSASNRKRIIVHINKHKNREAISCLKRKSRFWLFLLYFGRIPFIVGRKVWTLVKKVKNK